MYSIRTFSVALLIAFSLGACNSAFSPNDKFTDDKLIRYNGTALALADTAQLSHGFLSRLKKDARALAVRKVHAADSTQIELPQNLISLLFHGLVHIHQSSNKAAQLVTGEYNIHVRNPGIGSRLFLTFNDGQEWQVAWQRGERFTDNHLIDHLLKKFDLQPEEFYNYSSFSWNGATFISARPLNHYALGNLFESLEEIKNGSPNANFIDGNDIFLDEINANQITYRFKRGTGDCPSGCINEQFWTLKVSTSGEVSYNERN